MLLWEKPFPGLSHTPGDPGASSRLHSPAPTDPAGTRTPSPLQIRFGRGHISYWSRSVIPKPVFQHRHLCPSASEQPGDGGRDRLPAVCALQRVLRSHGLCRAPPGAGPLSPAPLSFTFKQMGYEENKSKGIINGLFFSGLLPCCLLSHTVSAFVGENLNSFFLSSNLLGCAIPEALLYC